MKMNSAVVLLLFVVGPPSYASSDVSPNVSCQNNQQCGPGSCCVLVNGRYPTTSCEARRRLGEQCRPPSDYPQSMTLHFPGGGSAMLTGVHESLCPCQDGAVCSPLGRCVKTTSSAVPKRINKQAK